MQIQSISIEQRRAILDKAKGQFFYVKWRKKDGSVREATCKHVIAKRLASGDLNDVQSNPVAHKPDLYTANDINKPYDDERGWVNITLPNIIEMKVAGVHYY